MFYAHFVLAKKGPLARIWLAAHWDKKLTKAHVFETNIESSVEGILQPKVKMALRTSGHLLLGIVRIYSRKAKYLLADCNEAFIKIKIAFRPGVVDLPEGNREAAVAAITLPEVFHDFDTAMPDITIDMDAQVSLNQSRAEDITLKEDYGNMCLIADDGFDDLGFDEPEAARDASNIEDFDQATLLLGGDTQTDIPTEEAAAQPNTSSNSVIPHKASISLDAPLRDDGFGGTIGEGLLDGETGALFEPAGLFDDAPLGPEPVEQPPCNIDEQPSTSDKEPQQPIEKPVEETQEDDSDDDMYDMAPGSIGAPSPPSSPESPVQPPESAETESQAIDGPSSEPGGELKMAVPEPPVSPPVQDNVENNVPDMPPPSIPPLAALEHTTLINNDAESFALAPLDATIVHGAERTVKTKRKRKLIVDEVKSISGEEMKTQLSDTTDIVATLDLAPPTKRLMHWKETGGVEKLFALPGHPILSKTLSRGYARHLTTRSVDNEDFFKDDSEEEIGDMSEVEKGRVEGTDGPRKKRRISDQLSTNEISPLDPLRLERQVHLDNTRSSYANEPGLPHTSLDVSNYYEPQHSLYSDSAQQMANQQQMMNNMHQASQDHMMQQMHFNDLQQMPHIPPIMDSIVQGPSLDSLGSVIPDVSLPPEAIPHSIQQVDMMQNHLQQSYQGAQSLLDINQQSFQEQLPTPLPPPPANLSLENSHIEVSGSRQKVPNLMTDDEATQICAEDQYPQPQPTAIDVVPQNHTENGNPVVSQTGNPPVPETAVIQNPGVSQAENHIASNPETDTNDLFDTLIGDLQQQQPSQQVNHLPEEDGLQQNKNNEYPLSDDDDYGAPASVGPVVPDEQMADETYEQFEERILTKRTTHLLHVIHNRLETHQKVSFGDLVKNNKRKQVAQKFYTFLVLKKQQAVELDQDSTYGDLTITKGPKYNLVYNGN